MTRYLCCDETRRARVADHPLLNGIEWLDVLDRDAPPGIARQQLLVVHMLKPLAELPFAQITGAPAVSVTAVSRPADVPALGPLGLDPDRNLVVWTDRPGGNAPYELRLHRGLGDDRPPAGLDPRLAAIAFSFKVDCSGDADCVAPGCSENKPPPPAIPFDTLARDYTGFRRLMLDRMRALLPGWEGRSPADLGVTLAELLAYAGDALSWRQDAVAQEAYLGTARHRISLRRHALLVDYRIDEGRAAEALVQLRLADGLPAQDIPLAGVALATGGGAPIWFEPVDDEGRDALDTALGSVRLDPDHHAMPLHDWGDGRCCLAAGATSATLVGHYPALRSGDWLILEEVLDAVTGRAADADPSRRHAVRLTAVRAFDGTEPLVDPLPDPPLEVTEIAWEPAQALPFALCLGTDAARNQPVAVARGNLVRAVHGRTVRDEPLPPVPEPWLTMPPEPADRCADAPPRPIPPRYRPVLAHGPLVHRAGGDGLARPAMLLTDDAGERWTAQPDLLLSESADRHLVAEIDDDGHAVLRFGDDRYGRRPASGTTFSAHYRVGGGIAGNVGAEAIRHVVSADPRLAGARNPLAAHGGTAPESAAQIRRRAPEAFRRQERAVTLADWEAAGARLPAVTLAAASSRWTGSWRTTFVALDRQGGDPPDPPARAAALAALDRLRLAGRDLAIGDGVPVPILVSLLVCVADGALRPQVAAGLAKALGSGIAADGRVALFHPDRLSFGQAIPLSPILAAARGVPGVVSVEVTRFARADAVDDLQPLASAILRFGPLEIARLDTPVALDLRGGR
ncbi:baseplate J/gp47 family protein [Sphingomonas sp. 1P06PA]|uniref:baseplate J/gp47 family protein n=1 Tax=Sphingomonas sp. 1P06PA TaxID=554121 RepID=UPI0039A5E349